MVGGSASIGAIDSSASASAFNCVLSDGDARADDDPATQPDVVANHNRLGCLQRIEIAGVP